MNSNTIEPAVSPPDREDHDELLKGARQTMRASLRLLREHLARINDDNRDFTEIQRQFTALRDALQKMIEQENRLNDYLAKQPGAVAADEIDLDALRHEIGCKLARLRACCVEGEVLERDGPG